MNSGNTFLEHICPYIATIRDQMSIDLKDIMLLFGLLHSYLGRSPSMRYSIWNNACIFIDQCGQKEYTDLDHIGQSLKERVEK